MRRITETIILAARDLQRKGGEFDVNLSAGFIHAVEAAAHLRIFTGHMVAVVGKLFTRGETRGFADDLVAFHHEMTAVGVGDDPLATEQCHRVVGAVVDCDEIDEGVRFVRGQAAAAVVVA